MTDTSKARLFVVRILVLSLLLTLFGRLWYLQVVAKDQYVAAATVNGERQQFTPASRGRLLDAQGNELVRNKTALVISVNKSELPTKKAAQAQVLNRLVPIVNEGKVVLNEGRIAAKITPCGVDAKGKKVPLPCWTGEPFAPVPIKTFVLDAENNDVLTQKALTIKQDAASFPGVSVDLRAVRDYPAAGALPGTTLAAQTLGYVAPVVQEDVARHPDYLQSRDTIGRNGLEGTYDQDLRGTPGLLRLRVNAAGDVSETLSNTAPVPGSDVILNLDSTIQKAAEQALQTAITDYAPNAARSPRNPTQGAAAVVMTTDGRIVALASNPSFDLSIFDINGIDQEAYAKLIDPNGSRPNLNRATSGVYAPGSSWKVVSSSAMLGNGLVSAGETLDCQQPLPIGNQSFTNFEGEEPGPGDLRHMLEVSCDTVFDKYAFLQWQADGAQRAGAGDLAPAKELFAKEAKAYGFGKTTGSDVDEAAGAILDRATVAANAKALKKQNCDRVATLKARGDTTSDLYTLSNIGCGPDAAYLQAGDAAQFAIGQGADVEVTPLQMARAYAAVANGGKLYQPTLGKAVMRPDGSLVRTITPKQTGTVPVSGSDLDYIRQGLFQVTHGDHGTAAGVFKDFPIDIAGKTGTAEVKKLDDTGHLVSIGDNSWFMSFGPYSPTSGTSAQYVVGVVVPDSGEGASVAAPAAKDIWTAIYNVQQQAAKAPVTIPGATPSATPTVDPATGLPVTAPTTNLVARNKFARAPQLLPCYVKGKPHPDKPKAGCVPKPATSVPSLAPPGFIPDPSVRAAATASGGSAAPAPLSDVPPAVEPDRRQGR